jgi:hypothetical protein
MTNPAFLYQVKPLIHRLIYQLFSSTTPGNIGPGKVIQNLPAYQPSIMYLGGRQISLPTQPLHRLRLYPETASSLNYVIIIIQWRHNNLPVDIALSK